MRVFVWHSFLKEEEVPTFVSSLKSAEVQSDDLISFRDPKDERIGFVGASFKWVAGKPVEDDKKADRKSDKKKGKKSGVEDTDIASPELAAVEEPARVFELQDLKFVFPSGALTIVTGQTGAGKVGLDLSFSSRVPALD